MSDFSEKAKEIVEAMERGAAHGNEGRLVIETAPEIEPRYCYSLSRIDPVLNPGRLVDPSEIADKDARKV